MSDLRLCSPNMRDVHTGGSLAELQVDRWEVEMAIAQSVIALIRTAAPRIAKIVGPALVTWLAKTKNREALLEALKGSTSRLPKERVRARIDTTILLLQGVKETSDDQQRVQNADGAIVRARRLLVKLDLPLGSRAERRANVKDVSSSLERLHEELKVELDDPGESDRLA